MFCTLAHLELFGLKSTIMFITFYTNFCVISGREYLSQLIFLGT